MSQDSTTILFGLPGVRVRDVVRDPVEGRVAHVVTDDVDASVTGHGPAVMATLRNLAIGLHRKAGATSIAAACRHPNRVLPLLL